MEQRNSVPARTGDRLYFIYVQHHTNTKHQHLFIYTVFIGAFLRKAIYNVTLLDFCPPHHNLVAGDDHSERHGL